MGALVYEVGLETTLPLPTSMEIVLPNGRRIGTVRRKVGVRDAITIELDSESRLDQRLAVGLRSCLIEMIGSIDLSVDASAAIEDRHELRSTWSVVVFYCGRRQSRR